MKQAMVALYFLLSQPSIFLLDFIKLGVFFPHILLPMQDFFPTHNLNLFLFI